MTQEKEAVMECNAFRDDMLDVLYGEGDPAARRRFERHQEGCAACRDDLAGMRRLRGELTAWPLPPSLRPPAPARRTWRPLATAAGLVLALGAALGLSGSEIRYDGGRIGFRLGRAEAAMGQPPADERLAALEARHRQEIEALRAELRRARQHDEQALLARVSDMLRQSEARQAVLVGTSMASLRDEAEARRRYDLAQVGASFSYLEGKTGLQAARTTELMGHVLQAAQKR
jgi:anti-sigma factor RsiW